MESPISEIDAAASLIQEGGTILYPTRTLWGIGGDARVNGVLAKISDLKGRPDGQPFLVLVQSLNMVRELTRCLPSSALKLIAALWPGELTLLLPANEDVPGELVGNEGYVGLRLATHPVPYALLESTGAWLISTSANRSGEAVPGRLEDVDAAITQGVDRILDYPPPPSGTQSSVVSVNDQGEARLVREGAIARTVLSTILGGELLG